MRKVCFFFIIIMLVHSFLLPNVQAQEVWDLNKCIQYAKENNLFIKQLGLGVESAKHNQAQSKAARLPNANGSASHSANFGRTIDPTTNTFNTETIQATRFSVSSSTTLYNGSVIKNTIRLRDMEYELAKLETDVRANDLSLAILTAYLQILLSEEQLKVLQTQSDLTQEQLKQIQKLVNAGVLPAGDLLDIEAQIANDRLNIVNGENGIASAYLALAQSLDYYEPVTVAKPNVEIPTEAQLAVLNVADIYKMALSAQPQFKRADLSIQIAEQNLKIAEGSRLPSITLSAGMSTNYSSFAQRVLSADTVGLELVPLITEGGEGVLGLNVDVVTGKTPFFTQIGDNFGGFVAIGISIPIYNNRQFKNGISQAKINIENNRIIKDQEKNNLRKAIEEAYLNAQAAAKSYEATLANIEALRKSLQHTARKFELGVVNALDYLTAKNNLTAAELNLQSAKYQYVFTLKILDFYQGKPLGF